jgi:hypothetical protein
MGFGRALCSTTKRLIAAYRSTTETKTPRLHRRLDRFHKYKRAVELLIQLHGDLPVSAIKKPHARLYREALQDVPQRRTGEC